MDKKRTVSNETVLLMRDYPSRIQWKKTMIVSRSERKKDMIIIARRIKNSPIFITPLFRKVVNYIIPYYVKLFKKGNYMNYILNKTPVRTSNNYGINDISLNLNIPEIRAFENATFEISSDDIGLNIEEPKGLLNSKIGLELQNNYSVTLTVPEYTKIQEPIRITFEFDEDNVNLVENLKIIMEEGSSAKFLIEYLTENKNIELFHYLKQETILKSNANANIVIANLLNENSNSFIAIENTLEENAKVSHIIAEFGGKTKISNYYSNLKGDKAENNLKTIYLGTNNDKLDINYNIEEFGKNTKCNIEVEGAITKNAIKNFKGTIDFKEGSSKSKGFENENCMILEKTAKSKSLPMLLCHEEDVEGEHGVSSGKIDESKIFYIMTKGISETEAKRLIVKANFNKIIKEIDDVKIEYFINKKIEETI